MNTPTTLKMHASYMDKAFAPNLDKMVEDFLETTTKENLDFDTIIGVGLSGALVVPTIARALGLKWAIVRKVDGSHSTNRIEGEIGQRWLFVDDFVAFGGTLQYVKDSVDEVFAHSNKWQYGDNYQTTYVGTYQYERNSIYKSAW